MPTDGLAEVVRQVLATPYASPRPVTADAVLGMLVLAVEGLPKMATLLFLGDLFSSGG